MRNVGEFLKDQRGPVWSVHPDQTVREALELLARHNIGALLVLRDAHLEGVFRNAITPARLPWRDAAATTPGSPRS